MTPAEPGSRPAELFPSGDIWEEVGGKVVLIGSHCPQCNKRAFPVRSFCPNCAEETGMHRVRLSPYGNLFSYSELHVAPKGFATPYVIGYVDLADDVRLLAQIEHPAAELQVDEPVEVTLGVIRTNEDGTLVISYKFRKRGGPDRA